MTANDERLRKAEIEIAKINQHLLSIDSSLKRIDSRTSILFDIIGQNKEQLDKWGGGVALLTKATAMICTIAGTLIVLIKFFGA